jgi:putative mRNA 3-end processing factor
LVQTSYPTPAGVSARGAILLGSNVEADGFAGRIVRVVTHAHEDHTLGLSSSARRALFVVATPTTFRFLDVLGKSVPHHKRLCLDYDRTVEVEGERLTLRRARHIAGSAQVEVEGRSFRVGYTGDFKLPGTPPMRDLDVLVIDATYGSPASQRRWGEWDAIAALVSLVEEGLRRGPVYIYGFNGKLQEVMVELRVRGIDAPFAADSKTIQLAKIASEFYRVSVEPLVTMDKFVDGEPVIVFAHTSRFRYTRRRPGTHIKLTGMELRGVVYRVADNVFNVSFSDHATFREVIEYVESARPRLVVVDAYRGREARFTAKYIERRLGIRAIAQP